MSERPSLAEVAPGFMIQPHLVELAFISRNPKEEERWNLVIGVHGPAHGHPGGLLSEFDRSFSTRKKALEKLHKVAHIVTDSLDGEHDEEFASGNTDHNSIYRQFFEIYPGFICWPHAIMEIKAMRDSEVRHLASPLLTGVCAVDQYLVDCVGADFRLGHPEHRDLRRWLCIRLRHCPSLVFCIDHFENKPKANKVINCMRDIMEVGPNPDGLVDFHAVRRFAERMVETLGVSCWQNLDPHPSPSGSRLPDEDDPTSGERIIDMG